MPDDCNPMARFVLPKRSPLQGPNGAGFEADRAALGLTDVVLRTIFFRENPGLCENSPEEDRDSERLRANIKPVAADD